MSEQHLETPPVVTPPPTTVTPPAPVVTPPVVTPPAKTVAPKPSTVVDAPPDDTPPVAGWPDDWRERLAGGKEALEATDKRTREKYEKRLQALGRYKDIGGLLTKIENQEKIISDRVTALPQKPPEGATEEAMVEWRKEVGLPPTPESYIENLKLPDGKILGDDDKPMALEYAKRMHARGAPQFAVDEGVAWYQDRVEEVVAATLEEDERFAFQKEKTLKDEMGFADYKRSQNAIANHASLVFAGAPDGFQEWLETARDGEGHKIGDHPDYFRWLSTRTFAEHPYASVTERGTEQAASSRLAVIHAKRDAMDPEYWNTGTGMQAEELQIIDAQLKQKGRASAA